MKVEAQWPYLRSDELEKLAMLFILCGLAPALFGSWFLQPYQIDVLGLVLFITAIGGYGLSRYCTLLGFIGLLVGATLGTLLAVHWWPGPGAVVLYVLPVSLATLSLGWIAGLLTSIVVFSLIFLQPFGTYAPVTSGGTAMAAFAVGIIWILGWIKESAQYTMLEQLLAYYWQTRSLLEEVRDQWLALKQANEDLAEAYEQVARLNEMLRNSQLEAELARRAKEEFAANVSHELRTPLNMIIGFSAMILQSPMMYGIRLPKTLVSDMSVIHRNSQHLAQLINDVLDLSQLEIGQMGLSYEFVDVPQLVQEAVEAVTPLFRMKTLYLDTLLPPSMPKVFCDRLRVRQILLNLLSNAGRFTNVGGVQIKIAVRQDDVIIGVTDSGPGIPAEKQQRIFEPFEQVDGSARELHEGSGLGLSISKRLVEAHGGKMWLESQVGAGATFWFSLPVDLPSPEPSNAARWINPYNPYEPRTRRRVVNLPHPQPRLLVLEKEEVLCHQASIYLDHVEVVKVCSLAELRAEIASNPPNMLLVNDPEIMESRDLLCTSLKLPERIPVVSCSIPGKREICRHLNVVDYLVKPIGSDKLLTVAEQLVPIGGSILIVEDNRDLARLLARQLAAAERDYHIFRARTGARALVLMRSRRPDAVFLDIILPDQDGYQVLRAKDADPDIREIPVVIISAHDPVGAPVMTNRLRLELAGGLSMRDVLLCTDAISQALSSRRSRDSTPPETPAN